MSRDMKHLLLTQLAMSYFWARPSQAAQLRAGNTAAPGCATGSDTIRGRPRQRHTCEYCAAVPGCVAQAQVNTARPSLAAQLQFVPHAAVPGCVAQVDTVRPSQAAQFGVAPHAAVLLMLDSGFWILDLYSGF